MNLKTKNCITDETFDPALILKMETLNDAIDHWRLLADSKARFAQSIAPYDAEFCREAVQQSIEAANVALALIMQRETGTIHCPCKSPPHPTKH